MKESLKIISRMDKEKSYFRMKISLKGIFQTENLKVTAFLDRRHTLIRVISLMVSIMVRESILGVQEIFMKETMN
jgi:uncharacterized DUF497 family protein